MPECRHSRESGNLVLTFEAISPCKGLHGKTTRRLYLAHRRYGVLYTGVTSDLLARIWQHKAHTIDGFSSKFHVTRLVWYESHDTMHSAIEREKRIEKWRREWKVELIEKENPGWEDLWPRILGVDGG